MELEKNKAIARRFSQVWGTGGLEIVDELASPDLTVRSWGQIFVQPLMLPILQVKVLSQELPIYLGSHIRLRRR